MNRKNNLSINLYFNLKIYNLFTLFKDCLIFIGDVNMMLNLYKNINLKK